MRSTRLALLALAGLLPAVMTCGGDSTGPSVPAAVSRAGGDGQSAAVGQALSSPLVVKVVDASGSAVQGVAVTWAVASGGGSFSFNKEVNPNNTHSARCYNADAQIECSDITIGAATQYTAENRPGFAIPIYAVAPEGYQPPADAPPLFVAVAFDDNERMTTTATGLVDKWRKVKVPVELHIFPDGGHGFGMNKKGKSCDAWTDLRAQWMQRMGLLGKS